MAVHALQDLYTDSTNLQRVQALPATRVVRAGAKASGLTVVVLNLDRPDLILPLVELAPAIAQAFERRNLWFELLVGDTGSTDRRVVQMLGSPPAAVAVVRDLSYQFSRSNNDVCDGRVGTDRILFLNNDVHLRSAEPLLTMIDCMDQHPDAGIIGAVLDFPNGTLQHAGVDVVREGDYRGLPIHFGSRGPWDHRVGRSWPALATTGAALMIRTSLWEALGGMDEAYERECQDVDLCLRSHRLGQGTRVVDTGPLVHEENGTRPTGEEDWADRRLFLRRWQSYLEAVYL